MVSTVHIHKGPLEGPYVLDDQAVPRITAFLFHDGQDRDPATLVANDGKSFIGSYVLGMGFTFDDTDKRGVATSLAEMRRLITQDPRNQERIFPYIGGSELNSSPTQAHHRYVINFEDFPRERKANTRRSWFELSEKWRRRMLRVGVVSRDYPDPVAADWPELLEIVQNRVRPERLKQKDRYGQRFWWRFLRTRPEMLDAIEPFDRVMAIARVGQYGAFAFLPKGMVYSEQLVVVALPTYAAFAVLQSRMHEVWARFFASSLEDRLRYTPSDCFETFPFPDGFETDSTLEEAGGVYYQFRSELMATRKKGLSKAYKEFGTPTARSMEIKKLRELHERVDRAVLRAYGWHDLANRARPEFLDETNEGEFAYRKRLFWPVEFRDTVLLRLLELNAERHAEEVRRGLVNSAADLGRDGEDEEEEDQLDEAIDDEDEEEAA